MCLNKFIVNCSTYTLYIILNDKRVTYEYKFHIVPHCNQAIINGNYHFDYFMPKRINTPYQ